VVGVVQRRPEEVGHPGVDASDRGLRCRFDGVDAGHQHARVGDEIPPRFDPQPDAGSAATPGTAECLARGRGERVEIERRRRLAVGNPEPAADDHGVEVDAPIDDFAGQFTHPGDQRPVGVAIVGVEDPAAGVGVEAANVEAAFRGLAHDGRDPVVGNAERRVGARPYHRVVTRTDARVHPDEQRPRPAALGEPIEGVARTDRDGDVPTRGEIDDAIEITCGRVDGGVAHTVEPRIERTDDLAGGGALGPQPDVGDRLQHAPDGVRLHCIADPGVGERPPESVGVLAHAIEIKHVQRRSVFGREIPEVVRGPGGEPPDGRVRGRHRPARGPRGHRSAASRSVASRVRSSTSVATTAGLYAPPSNRS
jgi:hypothetical protein